MILLIMILLYLMAAIAFYRSYEGEQKLLFRLRRLPGYGIIVWVLFPALCFIRLSVEMAGSVIQFSVDLIYGCKKAMAYSLCVIRGERPGGGRG